MDVIELGRRSGGGAWALIFHSAYDAALRREPDEESGLDLIRGSHEG